MPAEAALAAAVDLRPARHRVVERREEGPDTVSLTLDPIDEPLAEPRPGQFTMLYAFGAGEAAISVSAIPGGGRLVQTVRAVGPSTAALCRLAPGATVGVRGPFGTGWPLADLAGHDIVVVAGGIGLAPLRPAIHALACSPDHRGALRVLVGARRPAELLYAGEQAAWDARAGVSVAATVDLAEAGWQGDVGVVTELLHRTPIEGDRTAALVCGPEVMMRLVAAELVAAGVPAARVWVSLERNMVCAVRRCGHCQLGPLFVCADGPVVSWAVAAPLLAVRRW